MGAASPWMARGAQTAGMQPGLAVWQERRNHGYNGRGIRIYREEESHEFTRREFRNE